MYKSALVALIGILGWKFLTNNGSSCAMDAYDELQRAVQFTATSVIGDRNERVIAATNPA